MKPLTTHTFTSERMSIRELVEIALVFVVGVVIVVLGALIVGGRFDMFKRFERPVRCSSGHLFTTIWIPGASVKAIRLGNRRFQRCPVGHHWTTVERLDRATTAPADLEGAAAVHDIHVP